MTSKFSCAPSVNWLFLQKCDGSEFNTMKVSHSIDKKKCKNNNE